MKFESHISVSFTSCVSGIRKTKAKVDGQFIFATTDNVFLLHDSHINASESMLFVHISVRRGAPM